jgi:hypothetical protein
MCATRFFVALRQYSHWNSMLACPGFGDRKIKYMKYKDKKLKRLVCCAAGK